MANHSPRSHFRSEILQCPFNLLSHLHWTKIIQELQRENFTIKYSWTRREWISTNVLVILKSCFKRKARKAALLFCSVLEHFTLYVSQLQPQHVSFKCANDVNMGSLWDVFCVCGVPLIQGEGYQMLAIPITDYVLKNISTEAKLWGCKTSRPS